MGLLDFFNGKKKEEKLAEKERLLQPVEVAPGLFFPSVIAQYWEQIKASRLDSIVIKATPSGNLTFQNSSFGHAPFIPVDFPYPTDREGKPMFPLAQINFSDVPHLPGYPSSGYLQFYIDVSMGAELSIPQSEKTYKVLFFEEHEISNNRTEFQFLTGMFKQRDTPVTCAHSLTFALKDEYVGLGDVRSVGKFDPSGISSEFEIIARELEGSVSENFEHNGHKIGGYAYFTQWDPRIDDEKFRDYILLLQIDSDDHIMWADVGVANFFIHPDDLAKKDFSKVAYTWDCF